MFRKITFALFAFLAVIGATLVQAQTTVNVSTSIVVLTVRGTDMVAVAELLAVPDHEILAEQCKTVFVYGGRVMTLPDNSEIFSALSDGKILVYVEHTDSPARQACAWKVRPENSSVGIIFKGIYYELPGETQLKTADFGLKYGYPSFFK